MKILKNVLSKETLDLCSEEMRENSSKRLWSSNHTSWPKPLLYGTFGSCLVSIVGEEIRNKIISEINSLVPSHNKTIIQHYIWLPGSGIYPHSDSDYVFGMTIYLCDIRYEDGGIFIWKDGDEYKANFPEYNSAMLNNSNTVHMVTPVSLTCKRLRHTIQIWGL